MADILYISRYPFSSEAKEFIRQRRIAPDFDSIEQAKAQMREAITSGELGRIETKVESVLEREVVGYALSRAILAAMGSRYFTGRYAVAKSKQMGKYLQREDDATLSKVASEFGIGIFAGAKKEFELGFADYLRFAPRAREYKLVHKSLRNGNVRLSRNELNRVIEEAIRLHIEEAVYALAKDAPAEIKKAAEELKQSLPREAGTDAILTSSEESYPPCVKKLLARLRDSENLPHVARFYLATFLLKTGMKPEGVIKLFSTAPDFNEATTRYQVEYIAKKGYSVPACTGVESWGLCVEACRVGHPLRYVKRRLAAKGEGNG